MQKTMLFINIYNFERMCKMKILKYKLYFKNNHLVILNTKTLIYRKIYCPWAERST